MARRRSASVRPRPSEERILAAAEALFAAEGFGAPSLRDLLAASRVSTTAFYLRFPDKEAVLEALVRGLFEELGRSAAAALTEARSVEEGFTLGVQALVRAVAPRKGLVRVALTEGAVVGPVRRSLADAYGALAGLLGTRLAALGVPDPDPTGWALVGAVEVIVRRWAVFGDLADDALEPALRSTARALLPLAGRR